jgi:hypothetical protein
MLVAYVLHTIVTYVLHTIVTYVSMYNYKMHCLLTEIISFFFLCFTRYVIVFCQPLSLYLGILEPSFCAAFWAVVAAILGTYIFSSIVQLPYVTKTLFLITSRPFSLVLTSLLDQNHSLVLAFSCFKVHRCWYLFWCKTLWCTLCKYTTFLEQQLLKHFVFLLCRLFYLALCSRSFLLSLKLSVSLGWCLFWSLFIWFCCCIYAAPAILHGTYFSFGQHLLIHWCYVDSVRRSII